MNGFARVAAGSTVGALSDLAISGTTTGVGSQIENAGTVTGFVQFGGGDNSFLNNGRFNLRHFADTTADGGRDTLRVAIADLGTGPNNSFTNNGTLALPRSDRRHHARQHGAVSAAREHQQCNGARRAVAGPIDRRRQTFINSGIIDLQANPVAWRRAGDHRRAPRPGSSPAAATFVANGGTLKLDTVLNEGGAASRSDTSGRRWHVASVPAARQTC